MKRLFFVLDLSLLRRLEHTQRETVLQQLITAVARLWAAYQPDSESGAARGVTTAARQISWGYSLYDSTCPDLLLKPRLRRVAQSLRLPAVFHDTTFTDGRAGDLAHFIALLDAVTAPSDEPAAALADSEAPAAALARTLQSALGTGYLTKLQELADDDSSSGGSGAAAAGGGGSAGLKHEGLVVVLSTAVGSSEQARSFLGPSSSGNATEDAALVQQLVTDALPAALWQRCAGSGLRLAWVPADAAAGGAQQPALLATLQDHMQQRSARSVAAALAELAGPCSRSQFARRLGLLQPGSAAAVQAPEQAENGAECWPAAAGPDEDALANLKVMVASLEGATERAEEEARRRLRAQHRQLAKQRQQGMLPGAARRPPAPTGKKGLALLQNAQRMAADKGRKSSQPNSARHTPDEATCSDDQAHLLAAAAAAAGAGRAGEEAEGGQGLAPEAAAAEIKQRVDSLVASMGEAEQAPAPAAVLQQIRAIVDGCYASMLRYCRRHGKAQQATAQQQQQQQGAPPAEGDEATSAPARAHAGRLVASKAEPTTAQGQTAAVDTVSAAAVAPTPAGMRALLLRQVPAALAELRKQHLNADESDKIRRLSHRFLAELLLRLCICACGAPRGSRLPVGQYEQIEVLMQMVVATTHPIPDAGKDIFDFVLLKSFGGRDGPFAADLRRLQEELWDDELDLDYNNLVRQQLLQQDLAAEGEESGETPSHSTQRPLSSGPAHRAHRAGSSMVTGGGGRSGAVGAAAGAGPSNLGRAPAAQREASGVECTSGRPSAGTARASASALSGEHSGIQGGASGATGAGTRAGAGASTALTATSRGTLVNLSHIRQRYNNTKQYELQVRSKVPASLLQKTKLKSTVASSRPPAPAVRAAGGTSRAAAAQAAASRGVGAASGSVAAATAATGAARNQTRAPRPQQQVPATPDSRGKALRREAAAAEARERQHGQHGQQGQHSFLNASCIQSPDAAAAGALPPGSAIPDTADRPRLAEPPVDLAAAVAAASRKLRFGGPAALPGAILPSQQLDLLELGSANTSPTDGFKAPAPPPAPADGPTWLVAATAKAPAHKPKPATAVACFGALAAAGSQAAPDAAAPAVLADLAMPEAAGAAEQMDWEDAGIPASPEHDGEPAQLAEHPTEQQEEEVEQEQEQQAQQQAQQQQQPEAAPGAEEADVLADASSGDAAEAEAEAAAAEPPQGRSTRGRAPAAASKALQAEPEGAAEDQAEPPASGSKSRSGSRSKSRGRAAAVAETPGGRRSTRLAGSAAQQTPAEHAPQEDGPQQQEEAGTAGEPFPATRQPARRGGAAAAARTPKAEQAPPKEAHKAAEHAADKPSTRGRSSSRIASAAATEGAGAAAAPEAAPSTRRTPRHTPAPASEQLEPGAEQAGTSSARRRSSRLTEADGQGQAQAAAPEAPARRSGGHTPAARTAPSETAAAADNGGRSRKRRVAALGEGAPVQQQAGSAPRSASRSTKQKKQTVALVSQQQQQQSGTESGRPLSSTLLASIASQLGCSKCLRSKTGCIGCRPKAVAALEEAGLGHVLAALGRCSGSQCRKHTGCRECWQAMLQLLHSMQGTDAAPAPAKDAAAVPANGPAADGAAPKRRRTQRGGAPAVDASAQAEPVQQEQHQGSASAEQEAEPASAPVSARRSARRAASTATAEPAGAPAVDMAVDKAPAEQAAPAQLEQPQADCPAVAATEAAQETASDADMADAALLAEQAEPSTSKAGRQRGKSATADTPAAEAAAEVPASAARATRSSRGQEVEQPPSTVPRRSRSSGREEQRQEPSSGAAASTGGAGAAHKARSRSSIRGAAQTAASPEEVASPAEVAAEEAEQGAAEAVMASGGTSAVCSGKQPEAQPELAQAAADASLAAADAALESTAAGIAGSPGSPAAAALPPQPMEVEGGGTAAERAELAVPAAPEAAAALLAATVPEPVAAAMAAAGALACQLGEAEEEPASAQQQQQQQQRGEQPAEQPAEQPPLGIEEVLQAAVVPAPGHVPAAAAAAAAAAATPMPAAAPAGVEGAASAQRRRSGSFSTTKRLGVLQSSGQGKKRPASDEASSERQIKAARAAAAAAADAAVTAAEARDASRSPLASLLRHNTRAAGPSASEPGSPYEGAYSFPGAEALAAAALEVEGEAGGEGSAAATPVVPAVAPACARAAATAAAAAAAGAAAVTAVGAAGPEASATEPLKGLVTPVLRPAGVEVTQQQVQQVQGAQQAQQASPVSDGSEPDSALPDSQLLPGSPQEVTGPRAALAAAGASRQAGAARAAQAGATLQSRQRRLSPGRSSVGAPPPALAAPPAAPAPAAPWPGRKALWHYPLQETPAGQQYMLPTRRGEGVETGERIPKPGDVLLCNTRWYRGGFTSIHRIVLKEVKAVIVDQPDCYSLSAVIEFDPLFDTTATFELDSGLHVPRGACINKRTLGQWVFEDEAHDMDYMHAQLTVSNERAYRYDRDVLAQERRERAEREERYHQERLAELRRRREALGGAPPYGPLAFRAPPRAQQHAPLPVPPQQEQQGQQEQSAPEQPQQEQQPQEDQPAPQQPEQEAQQEQPAPPQQEQPAPPQQERQQQEQEQAPEPPSAASPPSAAPPPLPAAGPPAETLRHQAAARQERSRRDSIDSLVLPQSVRQQRSRMEQQRQEQGLGQSEPSPASQPRALFGAASPAPTPARSGRPPVPPHGPPAALPLQSPARLPRLDVVKQHLQQGSPLRAQLPSPQRQAPGAAQARPAAAAASPLRRLPPLNEVQQRLASPAQPVQQQQQSPEAPAPAFAEAVQASVSSIQAAPGSSALARQAPPGAAPAPQPAASSGQQQQAEAAVAALLSRVRAELAAGSPTDSGGSSAAGGAQACANPAEQEGCVLLYCTRTSVKGSGLPELKRAVVLGVAPLAQGSPRSKISHRASAVVLASGCSPEQLEPLPAGRVELVSLELGQANCKAKEQAIRKAHYWLPQGRLRPATLAALQDACQRVQQFNGAA